MPTDRILVVTDLESGQTLSQDFTVPTRRQVSTVQPYLVFVGAPAGTFTFTLKEGSTTIATASETYASLTTKHTLSGDTTQFEYFNFDLSSNVVLNPNTTYTLEFSESGYTEDLTPPSSFVSWIKPHESLLSTFNIETFSDTQKPFGFLLWGLDNA